MNQKSTSAPIAENKMGTMPVGRLVLNMSLPMMISMLVQALYNIVDSVFVAMLSENALTAVSMAFPLQTLLIAVGAGTGVGMNALLSSESYKSRTGALYFPANPDQASPETGTRNGDQAVQPQRKQLYTYLCGPQIYGVYPKDPADTTGLGKRAERSYRK